MTFFPAACTGARGEGKSRGWEADGEAMVAGRAGRGRRAGQTGGEARPHVHLHIADLAERGSHHNNTDDDARIPVGVQRLVLVLDELHDPRGKRGGRD